MRCKQCEYRLWNLTTRVCPECGTPFRPSQFEFAPNRVEFCCPHCGQAYFGIGPRGHLAPAEFECVQCRRRIGMDEMLLRPAAGLDEEQTQVERMPWLERQRIGFFRAWFRTMKMAMLRPQRLIELTPVPTPASRALGFAVLTNALVATVSIGPFLIFPMVIAGAAGAADVAVGLLIAVLVMLVGTLVSLLVWGAMVHVLLRLTGRTESGIGRTFQALGFGAGANALSAIPCLGPYVGWIWWVISAILMLMRGQRVGGLRATFAIGTPPLLALGVLIAIQVFALVAAARSTAAPASPAQLSQMQTVLSGLRAYAKTADGSGPAHALRLIDAGILHGDDFVITAYGTAKGDVPVDGTNLAAFEELSDAERRELARNLCDSMPSGVVAHRLGDYVFTYHGMILRNTDPGLWLVVESPNDPGVMAPVISIGAADGTVIGVSRIEMLVKLREQNALRAEHGLPRLPDPSTVVAERPAVK